MLFAHQARGAHQQHTRQEKWRYSGCHDMATYRTIEKWRYKRKNGVKIIEWQKERASRWGHPLLLVMRG